MEQRKVWGIGMLLRRKKVFQNNSINKSRNKEYLWNLELFLGNQSTDVAENNFLKRVEKKQE